ncbi:MAG: ACT domain-containing protein [Bacteroidota bacterium]
MTGIINLADVLVGLNPRLNEGRYVFVSSKGPLKVDSSDTVGTFKEEEGITYIIKKEQADLQGLTYGPVMAWITLKVHSSLEAIGLTAAVSKVLSENDISCNVVAAYYHDHIFVPEKDAENALKTFISITRSNENSL